MIVYGDPSFEQPLGTLAGRLQDRVAEAGEAARAGAVTLDALRALLIEAGQLEQATQDASAALADDDAARQWCPGVTNLLARAFIDLWDLDGGADSDRASPGIAALLHGAGQLLGPLDRADDRRVRVKVPEGFAFYTLYPEQYCAAAERWVAEHRDERGATGDDRERVIVVGVRSIGTSLSAVVAAVLARAGWPVTRVTVRPTGHPYERRVVLPSGLFFENAHALIVDEGPGHSGSSMAAAGQALADAGVARDRISFFPGHAGPPGHAAGETVRAWWDATPRHVVALDALRWGGLSLPQVLAHRTSEICGRPVQRVEDLGGGAWRRHVYADAAQWPAAFAPFERAKFLCVTEGGAGVLWKFAGLATGPDGRNGADAASARMTALAAGGWTVTPLGTASGFVATPWVTGRPLTRADCTPAVLAHIGRYIAAAARFSRHMDLVEQRAGFNRLAEMLYWNTRNSLGEETADRTRHLADAARAAAPAPDIAAYGDGRLAPHEWLRAEADGRILKTDCTGHDADHTVVGRQPVGWDVAAAVVEWQLDDAAARPLLDAFEAAGGAEAPGALSKFHIAAYAAFRLGMCSMCADMLGGGDPHEQARLKASESSYCDRLARSLGR